jgi:hypothetical protein
LHCDGAIQSQSHKTAWWYIVCQHSTWVHTYTINMTMPVPYHGEVQYFMLLCAVPGLDDYRHPVSCNR